MEHDKNEVIQENPEKMDKKKLGLLLFWIYFKCMLFAFTGAIGVLPMIQNELCKKRKILPEDSFLETMALSQSLPGIIGVNNAILTGYRICGRYGSFMAAIGVIFPGYFSMLIVTIIFQNLTQNRFVLGAIRGIRTVSVMIILGIGIRIIREYKKNFFTWFIFAFSLFVPLLTNVSSFQTIILTGIMGILYVYLYSGKANNKNIKSGKGEM